MTSDHPASDLMSPAERAEATRGIALWPGTDCAFCDPDLVEHLEGCPLAGKLRGQLYLRKADAPPPPPDDRLSEARLCEIEARAAAATIGPWTVRIGYWHEGYDGARYPNEVTVVSPDGTVLGAVGGQGAGGDWGELVVAPHDQEFIMAARTDVPSLIDEIRRQRDQIHDLTMALASMHRTMHAQLGSECP